MKDSKAKDASPASPPPITAQLPPPPYPIGILAEFTRHATPITLRIRELKSSFSGDEFRIKDAVSNQKVFEVQAKVFSFSAKKTLHDHTGRPLFEFFRTGISLRHSYAGFEAGSGGKGKPLFTVEMRGLWKPKLEIVFDNRAGDGKVERWTLRGDVARGSSQITNQSGFVVASISRDYATMGEIFCEFGSLTPLCCEWT